jgi:hypothetical protein
LTCLAVVVTCAGAYSQRDAAAAKPSGPPVVGLNVTVEATDSGGNPCRICSDGLGPYVNGVDGVSARLDSYGNLIIDFAAGNGAPVRKLSFDYTSPVEPGNVPNIPPPYDSYMSTRFHPEGNIQDMPVGAAQCMESVIIFHDQSGNHGNLYSNDFHRNTGSLGDTAYVVISRTSATTWEAEPKELAGECNSGLATIARVSSQPTSGPGSGTQYGRFYMPFKMTLVRQ